MQVTLLLADSAQTDRQAGKAHALGLGWVATTTPTRAMSLILMAECPWDQTNQQHKVTIDLVDSDGRPVSFAQNPAGEDIPAVHIEAQIETGRPPGAPHGSPIRLPPQVINLGPGMRLTPGQRYEFRLTVNDEPVDGSAFFDVRRPTPRR